MENCHRIEVCQSGEVGANADCVEVILSRDHRPDNCYVASTKVSVSAEGEQVFSFARLPSAIGKWPWYKKLRIV